ncbi:GM11870 [Drosophila sechellia]|uniref:Breast cancer type 2 susceptibility protein homolog n=1 Tax=Drosophila sechellia TaxID=7238 RepID=BRCA2_DROSE|nr:RecName: Full=Breast cancer type 2 susceptibility protein homolog [Drosophila sechellia]EDW49206.1 GM11870 [Drosophila sechellia]
MDQKGASGSRPNRLSQGKEAYACERSATVSVAANRNNIINEMAKICEADRQTSAIARRTQVHERLAVANSDFVAVEDLILAYAEPTPEDQVEMIMRDFCSSPTYEEDEDEPSFESEPWFRFRNKRIRTYSRKRDPRSYMAVRTEKPRGTSGLSVQRDLNTSFTSMACDFDAASSQKIHEVLLNLSQYFSATAKTSSPTPVPSQIDLPTEARQDSGKECFNAEVENLRDDLLQNGFTFEASIYDNEHEQEGSEKFNVCSDAEIAEHKKLLKGPTQAEHVGKEENPNFILEGIPLSEWLTPMEPPMISKDVIKNIPDKKVKLEPSFQKEQKSSKDSNESKIRAPSKPSCDITEKNEGTTVLDQPYAAQQENLSNDGDLLEEFLFNEWHPMQCSNGPSTSNDAIQVPKEEINSIKRTDEEQPEKETPNKSRSTSSHQLSFRKTSLKFIEISEEMKIKGEKFVDKVISGLYHPSHKCNLRTEEYSDNHSQVMESTQCVEFKSALNKPIELLDKKETYDMLAKVEVGEINGKCSPLNNEAIAEPEFCGFRTASNKAIPISEKMKIKTAEFMAEFQYKETNHQNDYLVNQPNDNSTSVGLDTVLKKSIEISEEMPTKASKLVVVDTRLGEPHQPTLDPVCSDLNEPQFFGFRTASKKAIEITEAMEKRGAMFLAQSRATDQQAEWQPSDFPDIPHTSPKNEIHSINVENNKAVHTKTASETEFFGFRTASNKGIVISENTKMKVAQFMSEFQAADASTDSNKPIVISEEPSNIAAKFVDEAAAEDSPSKSTFCNVQSQENPLNIEHFKHDLFVKRSAKEEHPLCSQPLVRTPRRSLEIHSSLSQLAGQSPLDQATKKSVIARRNLLSLKRKRKIVSSTETSTSCASPDMERFAPKPSSTSTPLADRDLNRSKDCAKNRQDAEDMSPICMQPKKSRRLGLSRSRY